MAANVSVVRNQTTRRFFLLAALIFPLIVLAGFGRTYYLRWIINGPPVQSLLVHVHGLVMTAWILLFATQTWLISSRRIKVHQKMGLASIGLAVLIVVVGFFTAIAAARDGSPSAPPDIDPLAFMVVPMTDLVIFSILFTGAIYYRKRAANHKRLMLLTVLNFLPPAVARIPIASLQALGPIWFFGFPDILAIIFVVVDTWRNKKLNKVFLAGTLLMVASHPLRLMFCGTGLWMSFATWLAGK